MPTLPAVSSLFSEPLDYFSTPHMMQLQASMCALIDQNLELELKTGNGNIIAHSNPLKVALRRNQIVCAALNETYRPFNNVRVLTWENVDYLILAETFMLDAKLRQADGTCEITKALSSSHNSAQASFWNTDALCEAPGDYVHIVLNYSPQRDIRVSEYWLSRYVGTTKINEAKITRGATGLALVPTVGPTIPPQTEITLVGKAKATGE